MARFEAVLAAAMVALVAGILAAIAASPDSVPSAERPEPAPAPVQEPGGPAEEPGPAPAEPPAAPEPAGPDVSIPAGSGVVGCEADDACYIPAGFAAPAGGAVTWRNDDAAAHTVTSGTPRGGPDGLFDSGLMPSGAEFSHEFGEAGTYDYYCIVHPWMVGTVEVSAGPGPAAAEPAAPEPEMAEPAAEPAPAEEPATAEPAMTEPEPPAAEPATAEPEPEAAEPAMTEPEAEEPPAAEPATAEPEPEAAEPAMTEPEAEEPPAAEPATAEPEPEAAEPAMAEPEPEQEPAAAGPAAPAQAGPAAVAIPAGSGVPGCEDEDACYLPPRLEVAAGSEVVWTNEDAAVHTVTSLPGSPAEFDSSLIAAGGEFSHTFAEAGEYPYFCVVHPWMTGSVSAG